MKVVKRQVEQFEIGEHLVLGRGQAEELYKQLGEVLGKPPPPEYKGCGDRFSHGPHSWGKDDQYRCTGRSFDAT